MKGLTGVRVGEDVKLRDLESEHVARVIGRVRNLKKAATILGIYASTLWRIRKRLEHAAFGVGQMTLTCDLRDSMGLGFGKPQRFGFRFVSASLIARACLLFKARSDAVSRPASRFGMSDAQAGGRIAAPFYAWEAPSMLDVLFVVVTIGFFAITLAYTAACGRL